MNPEIIEIKKGLYRARASVRKSHLSKRATGAYNNRYIPFEDIHEVVQTALWEEGLLYYQNASHDGQSCVIVTTIVTDCEGNELQIGETKLPCAKLVPHEGGSAFSYAKRYALAALFALIETPDDDGNEAQGLNRKPEAKPTARQTAPVVDEESPETAIPDNFDKPMTAESFTAKGKTHVWKDKSPKQLGVIAFASTLPDKIKGRARLILTGKAANTKDIDADVCAEILKANGALE